MYRVLRVCRAYRTGPNFSKTSQPSINSRPFVRCRRDFCGCNPTSTATSAWPSYLRVVSAHRHLVAVCDETIASARKMRVQTRTPVDRCNRAVFLRSPRASPSPCRLSPAAVPAAQALQPAASRSGLAIAAHRAALDQTSPQPQQHSDTPRSKEVSQPSARRWHRCKDRMFYCATIAQQWRQRMWHRPTGLVCGEAIPTTANFQSARQPNTRRLPHNISAGTSAAVPPDRPAREHRTPSPSCPIRAP